MRNVATRDFPELVPEKKWSSMPAIALAVFNPEEDEGMQAVAGRLEIRVIPKDNKDNETQVVSPVRITSEISPPKPRDRITELIEDELKLGSNHGSKESITENTVQRQVENIDKPDVNNLDKALEQVPCILNVEKFEIHNRESSEEPEENDKPEEKKTDLMNGQSDVDNIVENNTAPIKLVNNEISPKESIAVNEKEEANEEVAEPPAEPNHRIVKREEPRQKCSSGIDLTSHPAVTFVPANPPQPEPPRYSNF